MLNALANPLAQSDFLDHPQDIELARTRCDLYQAFELTYDAYFQAGLSGDSPSGVRLTPYHLLPSTDVIVAKSNQCVISTISLFGDGVLGLPMQSMYERELDNLRSKGLRLAEIGCLADRRTSPRRFIATFADMGRLLVQVASLRNIDALVAVVHPKHAKLYKRVLGFKQVGGITGCPYANGNPAEALYLRFEDADPELHQRFFGEPIPQDQLEPYSWESETRKHFARLIECDALISKAIGNTGFYDWGIARNTTPLDLASGF